MRKFSLTPLKRFWERNAIYFACFAQPAFIMLAVYFGRGVYPIGDHSTLVLDLNAQYIYYYEAFRQAILEGKSLLYSWSQSLSGEMIGIFGYYLASPFMIFYLIFPKEAIVEALLFVTVMKAGTLGVTFAIFARKSFKLDGMKLLIVSSLYALCAYAVVHAMNPMWIDAVILLPLIALGIMRLVDERRFVLLFATLTLSLIVNYYIGFMLCVLSVFFFLYYYFSKPREGGFRAFVLSALRFAGIGVLCAAAAMVILLPIYHSLMLGKYEFTRPDYSLSLRYPLFNLLPKLLMDSYDSVNVQGLPMIYCGLLSLLLLPCFFLSPSIPIRKKIATGGLYLVIFAIMNISILDIALHLFRIPNWLNCRYAFFFSFILLMAVSEAFLHLDDLPRDKLIKTYMVELLLVVLIQLSQLSYVDNFTCIWLSILFLSVYALLLGVSLDPRKRETMLRAVAFVMVAELTLNTALTLQGVHEEVYYSSRSSYTDFIAESRAVVDAVTEMDSSFCRMEKTYHRTVNDPMALGIAGLSHSTSTLNEKALGFIRSLGYSQREHWSRYVENSVVADSLLGFKYILSKTPLNNAAYEEVMTMGEITVYHNPYNLPIVFAANERFSTAVVSSSNAISYQNQLLSALAGDEYTEYFSPVTDVVKSHEGLTESSYGTHKKYVATGSSGKITYTLTMPSGGPLYACMTSDYTNACTISVNDVNLGEILGHETTSVFPLGTFREGDEVTVTLTTTAAETYLRSASNYFYVLDMDAFEAAYEKLNAGGLQLEKRTETYLYGTMDVADERACVYTSIPYEGGWTVKVDGEPVEVLCGANAVIAFAITGSTHTIEMSYCPPGLVPGAIISGGAIVIFAALILLRRRGKHPV
ncbi:MAG: YfhO family protein [Clostridiaceae bacterium]|nr:YfhO family protein [Clostridiaceae bacterium]